jgi:hypothetical protein
MVGFGVLALTSLSVDDGYRVPQNICFVGENVYYFKRAMAWQIYIYICMIFNGVHQATYTLWEGSTSTKWDLIGVVPSESGPSLPYLVISGVIGLIAYLLPGVNH